MALPKSREARGFYQAAKERLKDARLLLHGGRTTGAVYLAGYAVECMLKALVLSAVPKRERAGLVDSFRGAKAHDFRWLKRRYLEHGGVQFPPAVMGSFALVEPWRTDIRYQAGAAKRVEAQAFVRAVAEILTWAEGRL